VPSISDIPVVTRKIESADDFDGIFAANYAALTRLIYRAVGLYWLGGGTGNCTVIHRSRTAEDKTEKDFGEVLAPAIRYHIQDFLVTIDSRLERSVNRLILR